MLSFEKDKERIRLGVRKVFDVENVGELGSAQFGENERDELMRLTCVSVVRSCGEIVNVKQSRMIHDEDLFFWQEVQRFLLEEVQD
jgi:hypothetical protein